MKTCREIKQENTEAWSKAYAKYNREINAAKRIEFPIGAKVYYQHGVKWLEFTVSSHMEDWCPDQIEIKNVSTGVKRQVAAHQLRNSPGHG